MRCCFWLLLLFNEILCFLNKRLIIFYKAKLVLFADNFPILQFNSVAFDVFIIFKSFEHKVLGVLFLIDTFGGSAFSLQRWFGHVSWSLKVWAIHLFFFIGVIQRQQIVRLFIGVNFDGNSQIWLSVILWIKLFWTLLIKLWFDIFYLLIRLLWRFEIRCDVLTSQEQIRIRLKIRVVWIPNKVCSMHRFNFHLFWLRPLYVAPCFFIILSVSI